MAIPNVIELCAGYGGIGLGLTLALGEVRNLVFVEREISVARVLVARFQEGSLAPADIWSDVKTFDGRPYQGKTDILCAGYPCQPFSCAGKQLAEKDPRHLWPHVARIIREVQPKQVFLENVDAHLRLGFFEVARELSAMGYRIAAGLFSAEEVGAPHRRLRLFALAERTSGRRGVLRESSRIDRFTNGSGAELGDSKSRGKERRPDGERQPVEGRNSTWDAGTELAHRNRAGFQAREQFTSAAGAAQRQPRGGSADLEDSARLSEHGRIGQDGGRGLRETSDGVADTGNRLLPVKGRGPQGRTGTGSAGAGMADIPIFPPGPADLKAWTRLLMQCPDVEPAVCRASYERADRIHGRRQSSRVSRLRALGNGVVPLVAAYAYSTLREQLAG